MKIKTINTKKNGKETYQQDRIYDADGIAPALNRGKSDLNIVQIGNLVDDTDINFKNPQRGRVYLTDGISPALSTMQGGGLEPKVLVKNGTKKGFIEAKNGGGDEHSVSRQQEQTGTCY